jgi:hypothetical protein
MWMRREARHNGLAQLAQVIRQASHFAAGHSRVD